MIMLLGLLWKEFEMASSLLSLREVISSGWTFDVNKNSKRSIVRHIGTALALCCILWEYYYPIDHSLSFTHLHMASAFDYLVSLHPWQVLRAELYFVVCHQTC